MGEKKFFLQMSSSFLVLEKFRWLLRDFTLEPFSDRNICEIARTIRIFESFTESFTRANNKTPLSALRNEKDPLNQSSFWIIKTNFPFFISNKLVNIKKSS